MRHILLDESVGNLGVPENRLYGTICWVAPQRMACGLLASGSSRAAEGAGASRSVSLDCDDLSNSVWWQSAKSVFSSVFKNQLNGLGQTCQCLLFRPSLAIRTGNLRGIGDEPSPSRLIIPVNSFFTKNLRPHLHMRRVYSIESGPSNESAKSGSRVGEPNQKGQYDWCPRGNRTVTGLAPVDFESA